jgi:hypothetical protein
MRFLHRVFWLILTAMQLGASESRAQSLPSGSVTVTRARGDAIVVWDATPELSVLIAQDASKKSMIARLESDAADVFGSKAPALSRNARTLSVIVLYTKSGAISPTYHVATFEGVERLFVLKAATKDSAQAHTWSMDFLRGVVPKAVSLTTTGSLPPEIR